VLAGGELLLRKDVPELVAYAHRQGIGWAMHTHGRLVPKMRDFFAAYPPVMAAVSVDGPPEVHDAFRGRKGSFEDAMRAIATLKETGCGEVTASTTITRDTADRLVELFPRIVTSGADSWGLHLFAPEGRGADNRALFPTADQLQRVAGFCRRRRAVMPVELCNEWGSADALDFLYRDQPFVCGAGRISCVVSASGHVMACTTTDDEAREGDIRERRLRDIWVEGFAKFRQPGGVDGDHGRECWLQSRNDNACRRDAFRNIWPQEYRA